MGRITRVFQKGKMNKDVDERLLPPGEYREALNVQVATTDEDAAGVVQNILGNSVINGLQGSFHCVGSVKHEATDSSYWFLTGKTMEERGGSIDYITSQPGVHQGMAVVTWDYILRLKDGVYDVVLASPKEIMAKTPMESNNFGGTSWYGSDVNAAYDCALNNSNSYNTYRTPINFGYDCGGALAAGHAKIMLSYNPKGRIIVGDKLKHLHSSGILIEGTVVDIVGRILYMDFPNPPTYTELNGGDPPSIPHSLPDLDWLMFTSDVLGFDKDNLITGIDVVGDMLLWATPNNEPKRISISRSIEGSVDANIALPPYNQLSDSNYYAEAFSRTRMINKARGFIDIYTAPFLTKKNVTLIKTPPPSPLSVDIQTEDLANSTAKNPWSTTNIVFEPPTAGEDIVDGDEFWVTMAYQGSVPLQIKVGDVIRFSNDPAEPAPEFFGIRGQVLQINNENYGNTFWEGGTGPLQHALLVKVLGISDAAQIDALTSIEWNSAKEVDFTPVFADEFPRFSYRYRYETGEVSSFAPFTEAGFLPSSFSYHPNEGYNIGMRNKIKKIILHSFVSGDTPIDVTAIDLLLKFDDGPNIYLMDTVKPNDEVLEGANPWNSEFSATSTNGVYEITSTVTYATLPSNQLLRNKDTVPVEAKAQSIIGNRVVYGNYKQGYDLTNEDGSPFNAVYSTSLVDRFEDWSPKQGKSIKSSREYDLGIVWGDSYGRETPVQLAANSGITVGKNAADRLNAFQIEVNKHPFWASYYKIYVKVKEGEYYNFPVGRVYDASDGSIWLAIPSGERNKLEENKYITLKKPEGSDEAVKEEAKYKITSIVNEAPDFIKTKELLIAESHVSGITISDSCTLYDCGTAGSKQPTPGAKMFTIKQSVWGGAYDPSAPSLGLPPLDTLLEEHTEPGVPSSLFFQGIREINGVTNITKKYRVVNIVEESPHYQVNLESRIHPDDEFLTDGMGSADSVRLQFWKTETKNKPEFDGRFFVKIAADNVALTKLTPTSETAIISDEWAPSASIDVEKLTPDGYNNSYSWDGISSSGAYSYSASGNDYGGGGLHGWTSWFIDETPFAAIATADEVNMKSGALISIDGYNSCDITSNKNFTYRRHTAVCGNQDETLMTTAGYGARSNHLGMKGIFTDNNKNYFDLGHLLGEGDTSDWTVDFKDEDEKAAQIVAGAYFSFDDGANVYRIVSVIKFRLYNKRGKYTPPYESISISCAGFNGPGYLLYPDTPDYLKDNIRAAGNRRVTYRIEYELQSGTISDLANSPELNSADYNSAANLEFLSFYTASDEGNPISRNPAIMETVPEEVAGNIYYEATPAIPAKAVSSYNADKFFPIGSKVLIPRSSTGLNGIYQNDGSGTPPYGGTSAENQWIAAGARDWSLNVVSVDADEIVFNNQLTFAPTTYNIVDELISLPYIQVMSPNGFTFKIKIEGKVANVQTTTSTDTFKYRLIPGIKIDWSNCWGFTNGVESSRIGDNFNQAALTPGVIASSTLEEPTMATVKPYGLIYSGLYNSDAQVNNLNQFIQAEKITKDLNPSYGSIQKLHNGNSNLIALCEDKVLKILANKDALYNADGNTNLTATANVLGTAIPYAGEFGISKNPESFASSSFRSYFADKQRGVIIRMSKDGLTPISQYGMRTWFRDNLKLSKNLIGSFDSFKNEYNITLPDTYKTVTFKEDVKGWTSFKSFILESGLSVSGNYYTFANNKCWLHHDKEVDRNTFYNTPYESELRLIFNEVTDTVKSFANLKYSGTQSRISRFDENGNLLEDNEYYNLIDYPGWYTKSIFTDLENGGSREFKPKEGMWFASLHGQTANINTSFQNLNLDTDDFSSQGLGIAVDVVQEDTIPGCTDTNAQNYDEVATVDDGGCVPFIYGCTDIYANNTTGYMPNSQMPDGEPFANTDDGSCTYNGCTDATAFNYDESATIACGEASGNSNYCCIPIAYGCTDPDAFNYDSFANTNETDAINSASPCIDKVFGCIDTVNLNVVNHSTIANTPDFSCQYTGCTDLTADNSYQSSDYNATYNGESTYCIDTSAAANSSISGWLTWTNMQASYGYSQILNNVNNALALAGLPLATAIPPCPNVDDGSCTYTGCGVVTACNVDPMVPVGQDDGSCLFCGIPQAINYDGASQDCNISEMQYDMTQSPPVITALPALISGQQCQFCEQVMTSPPTIANITHNSFDIQWTYPLDNFGTQLTSTEVKKFTVYVSGSDNAVSTATGGMNYGTVQIDAEVYTALSGTGTPSDPFSVTIDSSSSFNNNYQPDISGTIYPSTDYYVHVTAECFTSGNGGSVGLEYAGTSPFTNYAITWVYDGNTTHPASVHLQTSAAPAPTVLGCFSDPAAFNYGCAPGNTPPCNDGVNTDDGITCVAVIEGCMDQSADNYDCSTADNPNSSSPCTDGVNTDDSSCTYNSAPPVYGCTDSGACNEVSSATSSGVPGFTSDANMCVSCGDWLAMDYDGDNNDFHGTDGYGGGGNYGGYGDTCNSGCGLYCSNPPSLGSYTDGITEPLIAGQPGDIIPDSGGDLVEYNAANGAWDTFVTVKISSLVADGDIAELANSGFIHQVKLTKSGNDANGVYQHQEHTIVWSDFTLVGDYYESTRVYNSLTSGWANGLYAVLDGEQYHFRIDVICMNAANYQGVASAAPNYSLKPLIVETYNV
jgi:hypothetical protein